MSDQPVVEAEPQWFEPIEVTIAGETFRLAPVLTPDATMALLQSMRVNETGYRTYEMSSMLTFLGKAILRELPTRDVVTEGDDEVPTVRWEPVDDWTRFWTLTADTRRVITAEALGPLVKWLAEERYLVGVPTGRPRL